MKKQSISLVRVWPSLQIDLYQRRWCNYVFLGTLAACKTTKNNGSDANWCPCFLKWIPTHSLPNSPVISFSWKSFFLSFSAFFFFFLVLSSISSQTSPFVWNEQCTLVAVQYNALCKLHILQSISGGAREGGYVPAYSGVMESERSPLLTGSDITATTTKKGFGNLKEADSNRSDFVWVINTYINII